MKETSQVCSMVALLIAAGCGSSEDQGALMAATMVGTGGGGLGTGGRGPGGGTGSTTGAMGGMPVSGAAAAGGTAGASQVGAGGAGGMGTAAFAVNHQLASDVDPNAPGTVGIVTWSVDVAITSARLEFGPDETYGMTAPVDLSQADYRTLLLGMKPDTSYHFRIVAEDGTMTYASDDYVLSTGPATDLVPLSSFAVMDETARERGFIVSSYWRGAGASVPFVIDADGEIVWWYPSATESIARARMSADGQNMWLISAANQGAPLERVRLDTLDAQVYPNLSGSHDLTPVSGATMAFLDYGETDCDSIFEVDPSGEAREVFESAGVVGSGGGGFGGGGFAVCHANALRYSQAEDVYTFSDVREDIFVVSRAGEVAWRLSERVPGGLAAWGGSQHGHQLLDDSIIVFANGGGQGMMASALVEYTLDGTEIMRHDSGNFSQNLGDVQRLPGGNTLITYSNASLIHEVDPEGNVVLAIEGGGSAFGYALWRESLYGAPPDIGQ